MSAPRVAARAAKCRQAPVSALLRPVTAPPHRPLYHSFAWAYDSLFDDAVEPWVADVVRALEEHGLRLGSRILDAGCGTGRYTVALADHGFIVEGIDASADLVEQATQQLSESLPVKFSVGDLLLLDPVEPFDAVICRGVLNDLIADTDRRVAIRRLVSSVKIGGAVILDVRDWDATIKAVADRPTVSKEICVDGERLAFRADRQVDADRRVLCSSEHLCWGPHEVTTAFLMRPWMASELRGYLQEVGCANEAIKIERARRSRATVADRLWCVAIRS
jgi:SAM-dependent methyltransferase